MFKQSLSQLLETEMDRKDFLKTVAVAAIALTGVTALVRTLTNPAILPATARRSQPLGYGSALYGKKGDTVAQATHSNGTYS